MHIYQQNKDELNKSGQDKENEDAHDASQDNLGVQFPSKSVEGIK